MTPGKARSAPVALAPAMRPCLLACVPSWTFTGRSSTRCQDSTQSPAAKTPSWPGQRWWSSTRSAPLSPSSRPGVARERRRRAHAGRHHDVVGGQLLAVDARRRARVDLLQLGAEAHVDADALGRVLHVGGHVLVERGHDLAGALDERHPQAALHERLGHLEADVAAADRRRALLAAALQRRAEALGGVDGARRLGRVGARDVGGATASAPVASTSWSKPSRRSSPLVVAHGELAAVEVDRGDLGARVHRDPVRAVLVGRARDEPVGVVEQPADVERDPARGVGRVRAALERDDVEVGVAAAGRARRAHPRRVASHDREPLCHRPARYPASRRDLRRSTA